MPTLLLDGKYTRGFYVGRARISYPFAQNGDNITIVITRELRVSERYYIAGRRGVEKDPIYRDAYLIGETEPAPTGIGDVVSVIRTFARIPVQQVIPGSMFVTKPAISVGDEFATFSDYTSISLSTTGASLTGPLNGSVYEYGGMFFGANKFFSIELGTSSLTAATGGTFTLTYKTSTTAALNWNDSGATIATALNGLAAVTADGLTFTVTNALNTTTNGPQLALALTVGTTASLVTMNAANLTPAAASKAFTRPTTLVSQIIGLAARVTLTGHGFDAADSLVAYQAGALPRIVVYASVTQWAVIDANTVAFMLQGTENGQEPFTRFGQEVGSYAAGTVLTRVKRVTDFYLPGVTAGIATIDDVPLPTFQGDDASLIAAVLAGSTSINYEIGELSQWRDSPILARTLTTLNAATL